jgi:hypothetical protein
VQTLLSACGHHSAASHCKAFCGRILQSSRSDRADSRAGDGYFGPVPVRSYLRVGRLCDGALGCGCSRWVLAATNLCSLASSSTFVFRNSRLGHDRSWMLSVHGGAVEKSKQGRREGREGLVNPLCESALTFRGRCYGSGTEYGARLGALVSKDIYPPHMACQTLY